MTETLARDVEEYRRLIDTEEHDGYFAALLVRDRIRRLIGDSQLSIPEIEAVAAADAALMTFARTLDRPALKKRARLRGVVGADEDAWWWQPPDNPLWKIASAALFALSATLVTTFATTTLTANPDAWGVTAVVAQGALTFLAGAAFTSAGKRWLNSLAQRTGISDTAPRLPVVVAVLLLLTTISCWYYLPGALAARYSAQALAFCPANTSCDDIPHAIQLFQRAVSLPKDALSASQVHFNFGRVYELAHDHDNAIEQYRMAVQQDPDSPSALNNWAWLLLLRGREIDVALTLLDDAARRIEERISAGQPAGAAPAIYKNRGLANFRAGFYELAERDLRRAIALQVMRKEGDVASPHCVLAGVLDKIGNSAGALEEARTCLRLSSDVVQGSAPKIDPESIRIVTRLSEQQRE